MPPRRKKALAEPGRPSNTLVNRLEPGQTPTEGAAGLVVAGLASNMATTREWSTYPFGDVDATSCLNAVVDATERVNRGDLGALEALLTAQAITLNALFADLAHRARTSTYLDHFDRYLRLALKSQSMCRATCETLAVLKNPPVFARQANIAHGPQQVNNGAEQPDSEAAALRATTDESQPNELLEAAYAERVDGGATDAASTSHPTLAAVGRVHRPADSGRKGPIRQERGPRRRQATGARADRSVESVTSCRP